MLTTLPGWAAHINYRAAWQNSFDQNQHNPVTIAEYLAFRLLITTLVWPEGKDLLNWFNDGIKNTDNGDTKKIIHQLEKAENTYQQTVLNQLSMNALSNEKADKNNNPQTHIKADIKAQLVFCIDVRSEPFRRALESQGNYETFGFAGFFGVPMAIENTVTHEHYASCPVLLKPTQTVQESPACSHSLHQKRWNRARLFKKLYHSLKQNFISPFALVETLGLFAGLWMFIRSLFPNVAYFLKNQVNDKIKPSVEVIPNLSSIPLDQQCRFAENALMMMGLNADFAPLVVFCGHSSTTQNNAFATGLNCGACGGQPGGPNARILAGILNRTDVRSLLKTRGIYIPDTTHFLAAQHDTTTEEVELYAYHVPSDLAQNVQALNEDLKKASSKNSQWRCQQMGINTTSATASKLTILRSHDWAQVRPEWGLARNACFIVGPRALTQNINLEGRSFLHSYDWSIDPKGSALTTILTAPMLVAHWISQQYLFSTLDNVAFGAGSKITKNITGKIGIMQGNASDLMHGLPLQSVFKTDLSPYHEPLRLTTVVLAPRAMIDSIIAEQGILKKLFGNGWVLLACIDPQTHKVSKLQRDLSWV